MRSKTETFATRLGALMKERRVTIRGLSEKLGISKSTLQDWRSGTAPTDFVAVKRLAHELGTTLSHLLTGESDARVSGPASINEVFADGGMIFDGFAKIQIQRLIPRNIKREDDNE